MKKKKQHHLISFVINLCKIIQRKEAVHDETIKKDTLGYQIKKKVPQIRTMGWGNSKILKRVYSF